MKIQNRMPEKIAFNNTISSAVKVILSIAVGIFLIISLIKLFTNEFDVSRVYLFLGFQQSTFINGYFWQIITYPFLHGGLIHLLYNSFFLWWLGTNLENKINRSSFLMLFFTSTTLNVIVLNIIGNFSDVSKLPMGGMSGGIYGIIFCYFVLYPNNYIFHKFFKFWILGLYITFTLILDYNHWGGAIAGVIFGLYYRLNKAETKTLFSERKA